MRFLEIIFILFMPFKRLTFPRGGVYLAREKRIKRIKRSQSKVCLASFNELFKF